MMHDWLSIGCVAILLLSVIEHNWIIDEIFIEHVVSSCLRSPTGCATVQSQGKQILSIQLEIQ